jgi:hypothetical protein
LDLVLNFSTKYTLVHTIFAVCFSITLSMYVFPKRCRYFRLVDQNCVCILHFRQACQVLYSCRTSPCSLFSPSSSRVLLMSNFTLSFIFAKRVTCYAHVEILPVLHFRQARHVLFSCRNSPCSSFSPSASRVILMSKFSLF